VSGEAIGFGWMCDVAANRLRRGGDVAIAVGLVGLGVLLLVTNPWFVWASSFDIHDEAFAMVFAVATARDLFYGKKRVWIWFALGLACGDVGASYEAAVGLSGVLYGRRWLRQGMAMALSGACWMVVLGLIHGTQGSRMEVTYPDLISGSLLRRHAQLSAFTVVSSVLEHPGRALNAIWNNRLPIWANVSPGGVFGWLWPPILVPSLLVLAEAELSNGSGFYAPGFQVIVLYVLGAVGTVGMLSAIFTRLTVRRRRILVVLLALLAINSAGWAVVWIPQASKRWLRVSSSAASTLRRVQSQIRPDDEVVVSQGVAGAFASRVSVYPVMSGPGIRVPVQAHRIWVILAPAQGIEPARVAGIYADIAQLAASHDVRLVAASHGVWAFEWTAPRGAQWFTVSPPANAPIRGWTVAGPAGTAVRTGPEADWHASSDGYPGYVIQGDYWRRGPGTYTAEVRLAVSDTAKVELWNSTTHKLLTRLTVPDTDGPETIPITGTLKTVTSEKLFTGLGPIPFP
jgi:hypothetical protein